MSHARANRVSAKFLTAQQVASLNTRKLPKGLEVYRCHAREMRDSTGSLIAQGPWFFASSVGRFDLAPPRGTLNLAAGPIGAVCEALGALTLNEEIPIQEVSRRVLVSLPLPEEFTVADFTDRQATRMARILPAEMSGPAANYEGFQSLAASVDQAGLSGICSRLRFSVPEAELGYFIFGKAGPRKWAQGQELPISDVLISLGYSITNDEDLPLSEIDFRA